MDIAFGAQGTAVNKTDNDPSLMTINGQQKFFKRVYSILGDDKCFEARLREARNAGWRKGM